MYIPRPEPPLEPCFQNLVKTRRRISSGMPSPSSSTQIRTPRTSEDSGVGASDTVTRPCPWRTAFSTRLVTTWVNLSGSAKISGSPSVASSSMTRLVPAPTESTTRRASTTASDSRG